MIKRRNGYYYQTDKEYVSVTTVLRVIDKPALMYWGIQQAARAALKDPSLNEKDVAAEVRKIGKDAAERGSTVHNIAENWAEGKGLPNLPEDSIHKGYVDSLVGWISTVRPVATSWEFELFNDEYMYAGKCDLLCVINGEEWLIDYKTSKTGAVYPESSIQLSAYRECLPPEKQNVRMGVVALSPDGFTFKECREGGFETFLHALALHKWLKAKE